ncbi:ABC transporter permease, partial [Flavonifractor plautii]|nr:ABC transporter permease [Flavonifractor plautii]
LMPLCSTAWEQMQLNLPTFQALLRQQDMLESYVYAFDYQDGYRFDGYDEESVEEDYRNKKLIQNKMYQVHLKEYEKINREGG